MTSFRRRTALQAVSVVATIAAAVVTNMATGANGRGWWSWLAVLTVVLVVVNVMVSFLDRAKVTEAGERAAPRHRRADGDDDGAGGHARTEKEFVMGLRGRHHVQVIAIVALMAVALTGVILYLIRDPGPGAATGTGAALPPEIIVPPAGPDGSITYRLGMKQGNAYDLDVAPGENRYKNAGADEREPGDRARDLYLSGKSSEPHEWQLYVPEAPQRSVKSDGLVVAAHGTAVSDCHRSAPTATMITMPGNAAVGSVACLRTTEGRRATVRLLSLPAEPGDDLLVEVTLN